MRQDRYSILKDSSVLYFQKHETSVFPVDWPSVFLFALIGLLTMALSHNLHAPSSGVLFFIPVPFFRQAEVQCRNSDSGGMITKLRYTSVYYFTNVDTPFP